MKRKSLKLAPALNFLFLVFLVASFASSSSRQWCTCQKVHLSLSKAQYILRKTSHSKWLFVSKEICTVSAANDAILAHSTTMTSTTTVTTTANIQLSMFDGIIYPFAVCSRRWRRKTRNRMEKLRRRCVKRNKTKYENKNADINLRTFSLPVA